MREGYNFHTYVTVYLCRIMARFVVRYFRICWGITLLPFDYFDSTLGQVVGASRKKKKILGGE